MRRMRYVGSFGSSVMLHSIDGYRLGEFEVPWPNVMVGDVLAVDGEFVVIQQLVTLFPGSRLRAIAYVRPAELADGDQQPRAA